MFRKQPKLTESESTGISQDTLAALHRNDGLANNRQQLIRLRRVDALLGVGEKIADVLCGMDPLGGGPALWAVTNRRVILHCQDLKTATGQVDLDVATGRETTALLASLRDIDLVPPSRPRYAGMQAFRVEEAYQIQLSIGEVQYAIATYEMSWAMRFFKSLISASPTTHQG